MAVTFEQMVTTQLAEINKTLGEHSVALGRIEQKELNGERLEAKQNIARTHTLTIYRIAIGIAVLGIAVFNVLDKLGII